MLEYFFMILKVFSLLSSLHEFFSFVLPMEVEKTKLLLDK